MLRWFKRGVRPSWEPSYAVLIGCDITSSSYAQALKSGGFDS
jgi:hypothetical protein